MLRAHALVSLHLVIRMWASDANPSPAVEEEEEVVVGSNGDLLGPN